MTAMRTGKLRYGWRAACLLLPVAAGVLALGIGRIAFSPAQVLRAIGQALTGAADMTALIHRTLWRLRLPRILLAALTGAGLSAGAVPFRVSLPIPWPRRTPWALPAAPASARPWAFCWGWISSGSSAAPL